MNLPSAAIGSSAAALQHFASRGYLGPIAVLDSASCTAIATHLSTGSFPAPAQWWKGHAVTDRLIFDIATRDTVLDPVKAILGPNVVLWGAEYIERQPGQEHAWHSDVETVESPASFVSAWIGIVNTTAQSGLKFVAGSHRAGKSFQQVAAEHSLPRSGLTDDAVLALLPDWSAASSVDQPTLGNGDAVLFAGNIWHASMNTTDLTRAALLLQYTTPDIPVLIPDWKQLDWPYAFTDQRAPSLLVAGAADSTVHDLRSAPSKEW